ncbi:hypothetical protein CCUG60884_00199 [Mycobacteroides salmoniphilum]|uniref:Uncharacterized protein n=1 Tax=Mycobacteroides salmoniphilum TaxID=404941 RepID=A0A4R8T031_9MYCO|nr:hypothetical protein CCUG60884_00199 [Mycobacteroides salmoniphilum]
MSEAQMVDNELSQKRRSGSQRRQRANAVKLNLLDSEDAALRELARRGGFHNVQAYIMDRLRPEMAAVS